MLLAFVVVSYVLLLQVLVCVVSLMCVCLCVCNMRAKCLKCGCGTQKSSVIVRIQSRATERVRKSECKRGHTNTSIS